MKIISAILFMVALATAGFGQNLDNIKGKDPFVLSGNISVGSSFFQSVERENNRSPFAYYIVANPTFSFYEIDIPLSFSYRDHKGSVSKPFQRLTLNPTYKWISVSIGNTSLNLSPYTLSGQYFTGASIQLTPGKFRLKAAFGNLENPLSQIDTLISGTEILPSYKRKAIAGLIGFGSSKNYLDLIFFKAKDDIQGSDLSAIDRNLIKPEENVVIGSAFGLSFFKHLTIKANAAASALTSNQVSQVDFGNGSESPSLLRENNILTTNLSTKLQFAGDASVNLKFKKFGIGAAYKRVDPLYKSLGTYYFQEDYHNLLLKMNFSLLKNKIKFRGSGGFQENNLNKLRATTRRRKILNGTLTLAPTRMFTTTMKVSNFQSDRSPVLTTLNDSLKFTQTTETYGITPVFIFAGKTATSTLVLSANYQKLVDLGLDLATFKGVDNYTGNVFYSLFFKASNTSITANALFNRNVISAIENTRIGGNLTFSKKMFDKLFTVSTNIGLTQNFINKEKDGSTITGNLRLNYKVKKKINIGLNANILVRDSKVLSYQEYRGTAKISYQFSTKK